MTDLQAIISVLLFDDHPVLGAGLESVLSQQANMQVVGLASNLEALQGLLSDTTPTVLVVDVVAPGLEGLKQFHFLAEHHPELPVVAYTSLNNVSLMRQLAHLGVKGFVHKRSSIETLVTAIRKVVAGELAYPSGFQVPKARKFETAEKGIALTNREQEVLLLIGQGLLSKEVADRMGVSINTVNIYRTKLFQKFDVQTAGELIREGLRLGYIEA